MTFFNDHVLITAVVLGAVSLYIAEMLFFWSKWHRLWMRLNQEGGAHILVQELRAEVEVLADEIALLRRQLSRQAEDPGIEPVLTSGAMFSGGHQRQASSAISSSLGGERKHHAAKDERIAPKPAPLHQPAPSSPGFSRGVEVLHRRVVELARSGMDSASIATECQLSQTETELILSLNGIKRTA